MDSRLEIAAVSLNEMNSCIRLMIMMLLMATCLASAGERNDTCAGIRSGIGIDLRPSYAFSSYHDDIFKKMVDVSDIRSTRLAMSLHLKYIFAFSPESRQGRLYPGAWQGIGASLNCLGNIRGIGMPVSIYAFQGAPVCRLNDHLSLYYEWNFGASFGWRKCDGEKAYSNLIVGSDVNACININAGLRWEISDRYALTAGIDLTHFSNGNTSFPNPGVNMAGVKVGVSRSFGAKPMESGRRQEADTLGLRKKIMLDVTAYGAWRKRVYRGGDTPVLLNGHFAVAGIGMSPMWNVSKIFRTGPSLDIQWDESTDLKSHHAFGTTSDDICFYRRQFINQVCFGISGRAELVMPVFSVNVGIGYNFIGPEETRASYELANLNVRITDRLFVNIGYQLLNFQKQNNLMLGLGYSFF
ncbi:MAG: acyloxyacyl hydrolase [Muribaculaceae bacterium]|nr:acyloxyacyl hydrolase [Muribaculaceae bacterium]